jgi:protein-L-isoaspartate(D-aspartate) O-methyltransferase
MSDWAAARANMVNGQVLTGNVHGRGLLDALGAVPRERFVPASSEALAYSDVEIPLAAAGARRRAMMAPLTLARLIGLAGVARSDLVLDVGCGTGYSSAVLARLASSVVALEEDEALAGRAAETLSALGVDNVAVVTGRLADGYPAEAPYDVIVVNGAVDAVPAAIAAQLGEGGRLVCVKGGGPVGRSMVYSRDDGHLSGRAAFDAAAATLPGFGREVGFAF